MSARRFFAVSYALMAREWGGRRMLEEALEKTAAELEQRQTRFDPTVQPTSAQAPGAAAMMAMAPPAPRRDA